MEENPILFRVAFQLNGGGVDAPPPPLFHELWAAATAANITWDIDSHICDSPPIPHPERSASMSAIQSSTSLPSPLTSQLSVDHTHLRRRYPTSSSHLSSTGTASDSILAHSHSHRSSSSSSLVAAGGAAGEDRVQVIFDAERSMLFCAIFDGFDGRDAADFLSVTLYSKFAEKVSKGGGGAEAVVVEGWLREAVAEAEEAFLRLVECHVDEKMDLARVGACVAALVLFRGCVYSVNVGDCRALLATDLLPCTASPLRDPSFGPLPPPPRSAVDQLPSAALTSAAESPLFSLPLTVDHNLSNEDERQRLESLHPNEPSLIRDDKVKGRLNVTRAVGAGYLKYRNLNNKLLGRIKAKDLRSPPYISVDPYVSHRRIVERQDKFVVIGSDGLFDFLSNDEVVRDVNDCLQHTPPINPAQFLITHALHVAVDKQPGMTFEKLRDVAYERKRKYHDDISVVVVTLAQSYHNIECP